MEAGRALDTLVAEKVMGRCLHRRLVFDASNCPDCGKFCVVEDQRKEESFHPSTDIAAAWEVVEKLSESFHWTIHTPFTSGLPWFAGLTKQGITGWNGRPDYAEGAATAPRAICLAALKAVGVTFADKEPS
jgi:hypothetical protein